jgi:hypothetical protein
MQLSELQEWIKLRAEESRASSQTAETDVKLVRAFADLMNIAEARSDHRRICSRALLETSGLYHSFSSRCRQYSRRLSISLSTLSSSA